jgi:hypothetical protein
VNPVEYLTTRWQAWRAERRDLAAVNLRLKHLHACRGAACRCRERIAKLRRRRA